MALVSDMETCGDISIGYHTAHYNDPVRANGSIVYGLGPDPVHTLSRAEFHSAACCDRFTGLDVKSQIRDD